MSGYLVDTDWIIDCLYGQPAAVQTLVDLDADGLAGVAAFLLGKDLLPLPRDIMQRFGVVRGALPRQLRSQVGDMDLLIAATALHHNLTLLARNVRDFRHIPGLAIYQPQ